MKMITYDAARLGVTDGDQVWDISGLAPVPITAWPPVAGISLLADYEQLESDVEKAMAADPVAELGAVRLGAPVLWPSKLIAYPANYVAHIDEMSTGNRANVNGFFLKSPSSITGPHEPVVLPDIPGVEMHHECELALIIGRGGRHIRESEALNHIAGYACLVDVTARGNQERTMRKSFDTFCPVGPWLVTADEVPDPNSLQLELAVNGETRQSANTRDLIVNIEEMIAMASSVMTLCPGDIIATGTPGGVGPIVAGDTIDITIEHVGSMTLPVVGGPPITNRAFSVA